MWNNFTGFLKAKDPRSNMNEAKKQSKRAGTEPSEQAIKRPALEDITNNKKPGVVKIEKSIKVISQS